MEENLEDRIRELDSRLNLTKTEIRVSEENPADAGYDPYCGGKSYTIINRWEVQVPDLEKRLRAAQELGKLISEMGSEELKKLAENHYKNNEGTIVGDELGKSLGYSPRKIKTSSHLGEKVNKILEYSFTTAIILGVLFGMYSCNESFKKQTRERRQRIESIEKNYPAAEQQYREGR